MENVSKTVSSFVTLSGVDVEILINSTTDYLFNIDDDGSFARHEFLSLKPWIAFPVIIVITLASLIGVFGNVLILLAVALCKKIRNEESIFIVNLALSDLYVTMVADPMSIVAKLEGEQFFERFPRLCQSIASLCTISCVTSLMTIAMMSLNRYVFVCQKEYYRKIFSKKNCVIISVSLYSVGLTLVLLNLTGIGDHSFDRKSLECIWDRMASYSFTVVFSVTLVWIPCLVIGICYLRMYLFVRQHSRKMAEAFNAQKTISQKQPTMRRLKLQVFKSMFIIYVVFMICWAPYALIMVIDINNTFSHEAHIYITAFAHLHPSINWLVYFNTQKKFALAFRQILSCTWGKVSHPTSDLSEKSDSTIYRISMIDKAAGLSAIARDIRLNHRRSDSFSMSETVEECQAAESNTVAIIPTFDEKGQGFQSISVAQQNAVNETDEGADAVSNSPVRRNISGAKDLGFVLASTNRRSISEKGQAPKGFFSHHENMPI